MNIFKKEHSFERRLAESKHIMSKHEGRIPIIVNVDNSSILRSTTLPTLDKSKFLVPISIPLSSFIYILRKRLQLDNSVGIYIFLAGTKTIPVNTDSIGVLYNKHKDDDGFLYMSLVSENVFGSNNY